MSESHADRNLLFGILALQMDFISRDALVGAMNAWVLEKSKPLSQVLLEQHRIKGDEQKLLESLVQKHLEKHGNDPHASLASLSSAGDLCQELAQIPDADLEASLRRVPGGENIDLYRTQLPSGTEMGTEATPTMPPESSGTPSGASRGAGLQEYATGPAASLRFQVLRPHAKGGLGQVSVAEDTELHREVALKEIQPAYAGDMHSRSRFLLEAEITGGLEHPGIVPVYGLGHYEDGRPYYAMRFIRGDSLKEAIDRFYREAAGRSASQTTLELRNLIGRLIDVCNAMEYAHSRGVLHRDLKPGNIMLGKYGETLVVDWGLAKTVGESETVQISEEGSLRPTSIGASAPTVFGTAVGTPQFMSPEQAAGRMQMLGPYSDVYSLGATLYCVLTGKPPFIDRDVGTVLQRVQRGDFDPPRQRNPTVPKPLEAVCLKSMALEPRDRYQSPGEMAADLERWLADEPDVAYQETAVERDGRWLLRNRTWAMAAAVALVAITGVSLLAALLINQARVQETLARRDAESSFQLARKAVDDFFTRVSETTLLDVPGLQPLRKELLQVALAYDQEFLQQRGQDPALKQEAAAAEFRIGTVIGEIGSKQEALAHFERARQTQQTLVDAQPQDSPKRIALATTINAIGGIHQAIGKLPEAQKHFDQACQMRERLASEQPDNEEVQRKLANSYNNLGIIERAAGHPNKALPWYTRANDLRAKLVIKDTKAQLPRRDLARGYYNLGVVQREADELDNAVESFKKSIELYTQLSADFPLVIEYRRELGVCHKTLGDLRSHTDRFQDAQECYERAREIQQPLAHDSPVLIELAADLAGTYMGLGDLKNLLGETPEALRLHDEAGAILRQLVRNNPAVIRFQQDLAAQQLHTGLMQFAAGENERSRATFQGALAAYARLLKDDEQSRTLQDGTARAQSNLGMVARELGALDEAYAHYDLARAAYVSLVEAAPEDALLQDRLGATLGRLAAVEEARGNTEEAATLLAQARQIHERWLEGPAATLEHRHHLAETLSMLGALQLANEKWSDASTTLHRSAELAGGLLINHGKNPEFRTLRASSLHDAGYALWQQERLNDACEAYRQAVVDQRAAFDLKPRDAAQRETLSRYLSDLSAVLRDTAQLDEALAACQERQKLWAKDADELYNIACEVAVLAATADANSPQREQLADHAMNVLNDAARAGFTDWQRAESNDDLTPLRDRPAYKALLKKE